MTNTVYIYDCNGASVFSSLLMNDLNKLDVRFSNINTTRNIDYDSIVIIVPTKELYNADEEEIGNMSYVLRNGVYRFKLKVVPVVSREDYFFIKGFLESNGVTKGAKYYQADSFNTSLSRIIAKDCHAMIAGKFLYNNKQ